MPERRVAIAEAEANTAQPDGRVARRVVPPRTTLLIASIGVFMAFVDATVVNIAFPNIRQSFPTASLSDLSWVLNAYNIVLAAFLIVAGRFADVVGRKRVFEIGLVLFTAASVLCALAPSIGALIAARILQGLGAAIVIPASLALILNAFPAGERAHAVGLWAAAGALAAGLGPSLGGLLVEAANWRLVFLVNLPVGIAGYLLTSRVLVESRTAGRRRLPDVAGALVMALALGLLTLGIVKGGEWGWSSVRVIACLAASVALGALFVQRARSHRTPVVDLGLFGVRPFAVANLITVVAFTGYFAYLLCNVLFLTSVWGYSELQAGLAMTPAPFVAAAVAGEAGKLADRFGYPAVLVPGALIWSAGALFLALDVGAHPAFLSEWLPAQVILGVGAGCCVSTISAAGVASAPGERFAQASGINSVARQLGAAIGVALLVAVIGTPSPSQLASAFDHGWELAAGCFVIAAIAALGLGRVRSSSDVAEAEIAQEAAARRAALAMRGTPPPPRLNPVIRSAPRAYRTPTEFLRAVPLFSRLDDASCEELAAAMSEERLAAGEWLFREGDPADSMYLVASGLLEVISEESDGRPIRTVGRGGAIGEFALLTPEPRVASVRARRDSTVLRLDRDRFDRMLETQPGFAAGLASDLASRLQQVRVAPSLARPPASTIALVPLSPGLPSGRIARQLADALGPGAGLLEPPDAATPRPDLSERLDSAQREHDQALFLTDVPHGQDAWSELCLAEADRILALTDGGSPPDWLARRPALAGCDLLYFRGHDAEAPDPRWWGELQPISRHAVDPGPGFDTDIMRVARRLSGRALGLVLSGGGARAFAHLGVIEEFEGAGIVVDRVAGTSMGAFIGGMLAMGMGADELDARCYEEWVRRYPLNDYRFPRVSLIRGERATAMIERTFGGRRIETLPLDFCCTSSDLLHHELVVHREGPVHEAVAASMCLPMLAPPRTDDGRVLVDGGVLNNLPVEPMAITGEGPIVSVDIRAGGRKPDGGKSAGGSNSRPPRVPGLLETLVRVILLGSSDTAAAAAAHSDVVITPDTDGVGLLEFHQIDAAREAGREAARAALELVPRELVGA